MKTTLAKWISLVSFSFIISTHIINAQISDPGSKPQEAKERYARSEDEYKAKNYKGAKNDLDWLLANAPKISKNIYIRSIKVYEEILKDVKEDPRKSILQDSMMTILDLRIQNYGEEVKIMDNDKGRFAYVFYSRKAEKHEMLFDLYQKILELKSNDVSTYNVQYLFRVAAELKKAKKRELDDVKLLELHEKLSKICEINIKKETEKVYWEAVKKDLDGVLENTIGEMDCELIKKQYGEKIKANPKDTLLARKVQGLMQRASKKNKECFKDKMLEDIYKMFAKEYPNFNNCKAIAYWNANNDNDEEYMKWMGEAFKYGGTSLEKADLIMAQARKKAKAGSYAEARSLAYQAIQTDKSLAGKAYKFVGDLYMASGGTCVGANKTPCDRKAIYVAAYNMYMKAGDAGSAARASQYFPTKTEKFTHSCGGTTVNTGGWVGETVTIPAL